MSEQENRKSQKEVECPICGARVSARRIYCPECGGVIRPDRMRKKEEVVADDKAEDIVPNNKPTEETVEVEKENVTESAPVIESRLCRKCGKPVEYDSKFCKHCGAVCVEEGGSFCRFCGAPVPHGVNFCKNCGTPTVGGFVGSVVGANSAASVPISPEEVAERLDKTRKRSATTIATVVLTLHIVMFMLCSMCDFLTVKFTTADGALELSQDFITLICAAFGGRSSLTVVGVPFELLKFTGWLYLSYLIVLAVAFVCLIINLARNKSTRPVGVAFVTVAQFVLATTIFALGFVVKSKVDYDVLPDTEVSAFMNGIGLFVCGILGLIMGGGSCFITWVAYRGVEKKRSRAKIAAWATEGVAVLLVCAFVFAPAFSLPATDTVSPSDGGKLTVSLTECVGDGCYGGAVIKLDGLEYGEDYEFSMRTSTVVSEDFTAESLVLYPAEQVEGKCITDAAFFGDVLETNQSYGPNSAKLLFTADYSGELAVVVMFAYYVPLTFTVEYRLSAA